MILTEMKESGYVEWNIWRSDIKKGDDLFVTPLSVSEFVVSICRPVLMIQHFVSHHAHIKLYGVFIVLRFVP